MEIEACSPYFDLCLFGTTRHSSFRPGLERLIMYVTGMMNVHDVIPFLRMSGHVVL